MKAIAALLLAAAAVAGLAGPAAAHTPQTWTISFITYRAVDAYCDGRRVQARLTDAELETLKSAQRDMVADLNAWNPRLKVTGRIIVRETLRELAEYHDQGCYPDVAKLARDSADPDTTMYFADPEEDGPNNGTFWWSHGAGYKVLGTAWMCGSCRGVTTSVGAWLGRARLTEVAIHEWLHTAAAFYRAKNRYVPDPHWKANYNASWSEPVWLQRVVEGNLPDYNRDGYRDGISHRAIHVGTPNQR